jgi:hypothetical protein
MPPTRSATHRAGRGHAHGAAPRLREIIRRSIFCEER